MPIPPVEYIEAHDPKLKEFRQRTVYGFLLWGAFTLSAWWLFGEESILYSLFALGGLLISIMLSLFHKNQIENFQHYRALEALQSLHALLDIRAALPPMRLWVIAPDFALLIVSLVNEYKPYTIVELGGGASTLISAYSLEKSGQGRVIAYDHIERFVDDTRLQIRRHGLEDYAAVIHAPLKKLTLGGQSHQWYDTTTLPEIGSIDMIIVDGPPEGTQTQARYPAIPVLYDQLSDGGIILVDDFRRGDENAMVNRWLEQYPLEIVEVLPNEKGAIILRKPPQNAI